MSSSNVYPLTWTQGIKGNKLFCRLLLCAEGMERTERRSCCCSDCRQHGWDIPGEQTLMPSYVQNITIPSALITKALGDRIKEALSAGEMVTVNLDLEGVSSLGEHVEPLRPRWLGPLVPSTHFTMSIKAHMGLHVHDGLRSSQFWNFLRYLIDIIKLEIYVSIFASIS